MKFRKSGLRILQVVRQFLPRLGGMQEHVAQLCAELTKIGHKVEVLTLDRNLHTGETYARNSNIHFNQIDINVNRTSFSGWPRFFWPDALKLNPKNYDIIHVHGLDGLLGSVINFAECPIILTTHGGFFHTSKFSFLKSVWFHTITANQLDYVDKVIACSRQDFLKFHKICSHIELIENGVDFEALQQSSSQYNDLENWLYVGSFQPNKRVDLLLKAFEYCWKKFPELKLTIVGQEVYEGQWMDMLCGLECKESIQFFYNLERNELIKLLQRRGIMLSASDYEGFGLSIMEGMASGNLLIVQPNRSFKDLFEGIAEFVDFRSPVELLKAYERILQTKKNDLNSKVCLGIERSSQYSWKAMAQAVENTYLSII